ncbi:MAG: NAD-dependent epimerase/dehydratase family protein [Lentisphaeria bacterium]
MKIIDKKKPVMVTGATGYVAGQLVQLLLQKGFLVHAAIRDLDHPEKLKYLNAIADQAPGKIQYFKSDLLKKGSYAEAMSGCELVFHLASPFTLKVDNPLKELIEPAKLGTRNVLEQATKTPSVKRVVLTSSVAAIYSDNADIKKTPGGIFNENVWNTTSSLEYQPYFYSKTIAEKEAWNIAEKQNQWDLVVINPSLIIGPGINPYATSESFRMVKQFGDGSLKMGCPHYGFGIVDVRDVAMAHFKAGFTPEASGRYLIHAHNTDLYEMGRALLDKYGKDYPIPRRALPKWVVWLFGPMINKAMTRKMVHLNVGIPWLGDHSKGVRELGLTYRPMKESMEEMFQQLIDANII